MPLYEYRCEKCTYQFTVHQSIHDSSLSFCGLHCPIQGIGQVKKLMARCNFIFKGEGFYANDYKKGKEVSDVE